MDAPPVVGDGHDGHAAPPPPLGGGTQRRFSLGGLAGSLRLPGVDEVKAGASRLVDQVSSELSGVFDRPGEHSEEFPAVILEPEPEPEDIAGWERRARSLEGHWRAAAETARALRDHGAAQQERLVALQAEADMAQAYAAQVAALEAEVGVLQRNEQAMRQRQLLAQEATADEQGEIIKLLQSELRDMQLQLRAAARQSREDRLSSQEDARLSSEEHTREEAAEIHAGGEHAAAEIRAAGEQAAAAVVVSGAAAVAQVSAFEATEHLPP